MGEVKYWDGEDFTILDSKNAKSVNGIKFRINEDILEYSNDGLTWSAQSNFSGSYNDLSDKPTIPSDTNQLAKTDVYTKTEVNDLMSNVGQGDMVKAIYDTNNNGIVDNAEKVNGFTVEINVPSNAKFTDTNTTYTEITTAEIDAGTASTLRTITGRRIKYILDKVQGWIGGLTKSDVGLGNVDNVKQASKEEFDGHNKDATRHITSVERTKWNAVDNKVDKVTGKGLSANDYTTVEKNKLSGIAAGAQVNAVTSVASKTGAVTLTKTDVGLANVDNIKQASKTEFDSHDSNTTKHITSAERTNWSSKETTTGSQAKATLAETNAKEYADTELAKKVDKVTGKGLSANDYTTVEKNKLSGIATGANNYTHPTSHPASIITETSSKRFVTDSEKANWNSKASTNTTYSEISTSEIDSGTSSISRTISGRRVQNIVDKARSSTTKSDVGLGNVDNLSATSIRSGTTKANVGLSNVDNVKQMPISGGILENYREKLTTVSPGGGAIYLSRGNVFQHSPSGNRTYTINNAANGQAHSFTLIITQTYIVRTLTFPASVKWQGGEIPDLSTANKTYVLTFISVDGGTTWLGMFGGEF